MKKTCSKCNEEKLLEEFRFKNKAADIRAPWCKPCFSSYEKERWVNSPERRQSNISHNKDRRRRNMQYVWDYLKTHPCPCGENDPIVLEFDHRDPGTKTQDVSTLARSSYGIDAIDAEIAKCDVLCANCHRRKTAEQFGWHMSVIR